jgi:hypothetical protein
MPIFLQLSRIDRLAVLVAQGAVTDDDVARVVDELIAARVHSFAKIVDTAASTSQLTREQIDVLVHRLRDDASGEVRGPVAFVIDAERVGFAQAFAELSRGDRPIKLFTSLREARQWVAQAIEDGKGRPAGTTAAEALGDDRRHLREVENKRERR